MNIDDLTIGQAKQLASMFGDRPQIKAMHPAVGKYCLVRSHMMGCFAGEVLSVSDPNLDGTRNVVLNNSRQLWRWWCKEGVGLGSVAAYGLAKRDEVRVGGQIVRQEIAGCGQIIEATGAAMFSISEYPVTQS
jgi:hypothetical protein